MRAGRQDEDKTLNGMADLKKMFSAHVQENVILHKQKTDLDFAKVKKIRELNHDESLFLRKYEKYAIPRARRRNSVDVGSLRRPGSRLDEDGGSQKVLGRMAVSNDCPYSLDTWAKLVDVDKKFLDENRNTLLSNSMCESREDSFVTPTSPRKIEPLLLNREKSSNTIRRNSVITVDAKNEEEEIMCIQRANKPRPRRHSLHPLHVMPKTPGLQGRRKSMDAGLPLPNINTDFKTLNGDNSSSNPDVHTDTEDKQGTLVPNQKRSVSRGPSFRESLSDISEKKSENDEEENISPRATLKKSPLVVKKSGQTNITNPVPKPIPNATVFIRDEDGNSGRASKSKCLECNGNEAKCEHTAELAKDGSLPAISKNASLVGTPDIKSVKTVKFNDHHETDSHSDSDNNPKPSELKSRKRFRRFSTGIVALQHMVDNLHGVAKLKYIDRLASEMQKEAGISSASPEEDKTFEQLQSCRYLRVSSQPAEDDIDLWNFKDTR